MSQTPSSQSRSVIKVATFISPELHAKLKKRTKKEKKSIYRFVADLIEAELVR